MGGVEMMGGTMGAKGEGRFLERSLGKLEEGFVCLLFF